MVGAGAALGQATALALAEAGLTVVAVDRNEAGLKELPDSIRSEVVDATDPSRLARESSRRLALRRTASARRRSPT